MKTLLAEKKWGNAGEKALALWMRKDLVGWMSQLEGLQDVTPGRATMIYGCRTMNSPFSRSSHLFPDHLTFFPIISPFECGTVALSYRHTRELRDSRHPDAARESDGLELEDVRAPFWLSVEWCMRSCMALTDLSPLASPCMPLRRGPPPTRKRAMPPPSFDDLPPNLRNERIVRPAPPPRPSFTPEERAQYDDFCMR